MSCLTNAGALATAFADLERDGFAVIPDVLSEQEVARLRTRLREVARFERAAGIDHDPKWEDGPRNQRVFGLLNKGSVFTDLAEHPVALNNATSGFAVGIVSLIAAAAPIGG